MAEGEHSAGPGEQGDGGDGEGEVNDDGAVGEGIDACEEAAEKEEGRENEEDDGEQGGDDGGAEAPGGFAPEAVRGGWTGGVLRGRFLAGHGEGYGRVGGSLIRLAFTVARKLLMVNCASGCRGGEGPGGGETTGDPPIRSVAEV